MRRKVCIWAVLLFAGCVSGGRPQERTAPVVRESARNIPVAYQSDVVVVGGSTGAVSAAVAAAKAGAKVFLAAPRPYLGEDMCATLRLWLEASEIPESPLAKKLFAAPSDKAQPFDPQCLVDFRYEADRPSSPIHSDTEVPSRLGDRAYDSASRESVQYDGDVTLTVDLPQEQEIAQVGVMAYQRKGDFRVGTVTVYTSDDKKEWRQVGAVKNAPAQQEEKRDECVPLLTAVSGKTRYLRLALKQSPDAKRILLGEIVVLGPRPAASSGVPVLRLVATPMQIKKALDEALLEAKVDFLYGCYATDLLRDADDKPCGIVMANRAGRQAVVAKVIIDATDRAWVARMAAEQASPFPAGPQMLRRVVIGGDVRTGEDMTARKIGAPYAARVKVGPKGREQIVPRSYQTIEYALTIPMSDGGYASWARAEQVAHDMTYHPDQQFASEVLFQVPPDWIRCEKSYTGEWGAEKLDVAAFRPAGIPRMFVLNGSADIPRDQAEKLMRPLALMDMGERIGAAAAEQANTLSPPRGGHIPGREGRSVASGDAREILTGVRPTQQLPTIPEEGRALPVLGKYDVVVVGGGTSGAPAGIAAARQGAKTLVIEYLQGLGGVGTLGMITVYCSGNRAGFTKEVCGGATNWEAEQKMEWWRTALRKAGADIWFGALGCGAFVEDGRVKGVVVATPEGRGVVLAKVVVDSTGNSDVAAAAGADCVYADDSDIAIQGTGLPYRNLGSRYINTDFTIADETDMMDAWHLFVYAKDRYKKHFDLGQLIDTRERRRIVGDFTVTVLDQVNKRTYPDTIVESSSGFDTHGYTIDPYLALENPKGLRTYTPYRCLLPKGLEGILVTGLGISAHRDAMPVIRMQPDLQNQGYAAGVAAAMAAKRKCGTRKIDVRKLQRHLVKIGNLRESVLTDQDSYPLTLEQVLIAAESVKNGYKGVSVLLASPEQALPCLRHEYAAASDKDKLTYAHILGIMGDPTGLDTLIKAVEGAKEWDKGWPYKAMGQFGHDMSLLDSYIFAMGRTRDRRATPTILAKVKLLDATKEFSHHRAVALALESLRDPAAAEPLAELLAKPGMTGHTILSVDAARQRGVGGSDTALRRDSLREIVLARALYRCGDKDGLGKKLLEAYANDLRGHFARHAAAVLRSNR
jgi:hypothetical protein